MPKYAKGYNQPVDAIPGRGWAVILSGTTINLCLGCLYAWSVWLKYLTDDVYMKAHGWAGALTAEQASNPKSLCILIFALLMIPGGKIQDKYGPSVAGTIGAIFMGLGMIIAGTAHSYAGILWGFGVGGGAASCWGAPPPGMAAAGSEISSPPDAAGAAGAEGVAGAGEGVAGAGLGAERPVGGCVPAPAQNTSKCRT